MNDDVQRVLRSMGLEDAQPAPTGEDDVARVLRSMGLHDDQPAAPTQKSYAGLADLSGFKTPEESIADFTQADKDRINEYGPAILAGAAGLALPVAPLAAGVGSVLLGTAARAATPLLKGEGMDAALHEADPRTHPYATALEFGLPFAGKAIAAGLGPRLSEKYADFGRAVSANAELPPVDELISYTPIGETVSRDAVTLSPWEKLRAATTGPARYLLRGDSEASRLGGQTIRGIRQMASQTKEQARHEIERIFAGMSVDDAEKVREVMQGVTDPAAVAPTVARAAADARTLLDDIGARAKGITGMMTRDEDGTRRAFETISENYFPHILREAPKEIPSASLLRRAGYVDPVQHARTGEFNPHVHVTNAKDALLAYVDRMSQDMALSHYVGEAGPGFRWGSKADPIYEQLLQENPLRAKIFSSRMDKVMYPPKTSDADAVFNALAAKTGHVALGQSAMTSWPQAATNLMRNGIGNTIEGTARWLTDPDMRRLYEASGALDAGVTNMATEAGVSRGALPSRLMKWTEGKLRGVLNAGAVPHAEKLLAAAQDGSLNAAKIRQLRELGVSLDEATQGPTADLLRRMVQASSDSNQLQAHAIDNAAALYDSGAARFVGQFSQYPSDAYRLAQDTVAEPILSGIRHAAPSDVALGVGRAARWIPATLAIAELKDALKAKMSGQDADPMNGVYSTAETIGGLPASLATTAYRGFNPVKDIGAAPGIGIASQAYDSGKRIVTGKEPGRGAAELLIDLLAAYDKSGITSTLRPSARGFLKGRKE